MTLFNDFINVNVLVESNETCFTIVKNIIQIFYQLGNKPSKSVDMEKVKSEKKTCQELTCKDITSSIRANMGTWSNLAKKFKITCHEKDKDGCTNSNTYHRICSKSAKNGTRERLYWINNEIAKKLFIQPFPTQTMVVKSNKRCSESIQDSIIPEKKQKLYKMASFESQHMTVEELDKIISMPLAQDVENLMAMQTNDFDFFTENFFETNDNIASVETSYWLNFSNIENDLFESILSMPLVF